MSSMSSLLPYPSILNNLQVHAVQGHPELRFHPSFVCFDHYILCAKYIDFSLTIMCRTFQLFLWKLFCCFIYLFVGSRVSVCKSPEVVPAICIGGRWGKSYLQLGLVPKWVKVDLHKAFYLFIPDHIPLAFGYSNICTCAEHNW